jgi:hypothetical protein
MHFPQDIMDTAPVNVNAPAGDGPERQTPAAPLQGGLDGGERLMGIDIMEAALALNGTSSPSRSDTDIAAGTQAMGMGMGMDAEAADPTDVKRPRIA